MLRIRPLHVSEEIAWQEVMPEGVGTGLNEDTDYLLNVECADSRVFVDDVSLQLESPQVFRWRPNFYAGRVVAEVVSGANSRHRYHLDVSPSCAKSGQDEFDDMLKEIRAFDQSMLNGLSSATMEFGHTSCSGRYELDVLLTRVREHGPSFLNAVERIVQSPHRFLAADTQILPLSRVRRLHHTALQDRRLAAIATGQALPSEAMDSFQISSLTSAPTFDTPANRTLAALLRRFGATLILLEEATHRLGLGAPEEEQLLRSDRRLRDLRALSTRTHKFLFGTLFREVSKVGSSAAGFTQIASQPNYSKAFRIGYRALATQLGGWDASDQLHVPPSWGIYESWCFLCVLTCVAQVTGAAPSEHRAKATAAERAARFDLPGDHWLEVLFQSTFPSLKPAKNRLGWSLSGERRPDIVLIRHGASNTSAMVFDAKWRSGKSNVLQAMESAHIYHDALRIDKKKPASCILLLPGLPCVAELEKDEFIKMHGVGAVSAVLPAAAGLSQLRELIRTWLES